eukprot:gene17859-24949_t
MHQSLGVTMGQLQRFRTICTSHKGFKIATTTSLIQRLIARSHPLNSILKAWNYHLIKYSSAQIQKHHLHKWFKKMVKWVLHNPTKPAPQLINSLAHPRTAHFQLNNSSFAPIPPQTPIIINSTSSNVRVPPNNEPFTEPSLFQQSNTSSHKRTTHLNINSSTKNS